MPQFAIDASFDYQVAQPSHLLFHIEVASTDEQTIVEERLEIEPPLAVRRFEHDPSGNRLFRVDVPPGPLSVHYRARVDLRARAAAAEPAIDDGALRPTLPEIVGRLPDDLLYLLSPTRYCESDLLGPAADKLFGRLAPGAAQVHAVARWLQQNLDYVVGSSDTTTTARDVFVQRRGVCRDYAHLGIALCRALNIPARFVVGYVRFKEPPPDFHAIFEAWIDGRWQLFDATGLAPVDTLVRVGTGRDAKDVPFCTLWGGATMQRMAPLIEPLD